MRPLIVFLFVAALGLVGCGGCGGEPFRRLAWGFRTVNYTAELTESVDKAFAAYGSAEMTRCKAAHPAAPPASTGDATATPIASPEYVKCIMPAVKLLRAWSGEEKGKPTGAGILPAIQSAQRAARLSLDAAFDFLHARGGKCKAEDTECSAKLEAWKAAIRPGLCALWEIVDRGVQLGAFTATTSSAYKTVKEMAGALCPAK